MMEAQGSQHKDLLKQLRDFSAGPLIGALISMFTVPITTRLVSPEEFGKSSLFAIMQTIFSLVAFLGLDQSFVRFYNDDKVDRKELLYHSLCLPFGVCLLIIGSIAIFGNQISLFLFGQKELAIMVSFCFFLPSVILNRFALLLIRMDLRGKLYSFLNIVTQLINFIALLAFLLFYERTFRSIVYATIIGSIVNTILSILLTRQYWHFKIASFSRPLLVKLLSFGLPLVPATLLSWLLNSFDRVALRSLSTFSELGLYAAAFKIVSLLSIIQTIFTTTWVPIAYKWHEDRIDTKEFDRVSTVVLAVMSITFGCVVMMREPILLMLGPAYRNTSALFVFLLFVPVMYTVSETTTLGIAFSRKTIYNLYISIIAAGLNVLGNYLLIPKYGAQGAAFTTCVSYIVFFWARTLFSRKLWYKFGLFKYFVDILLLLVLSLLVFAGAPRCLEALNMLLIVAFNVFLLYGRAHTRGYP